MTHTHRMVNGERVDLTPEEIEARVANDAAEQSRRDREVELQPLEDLYKARKKGYGSAAKQLEIIAEGGEQDLAAHCAAVKAAHPMTAELQALKDSCTEEELKRIRG